MGLMCRAQWMTQWVGFETQSSHLVHFFSYFLPVIQIDYLLLDYGQLRMPTTTSHTNTQTTKGGQILDLASYPLLSQWPLPPQHSMTTSGARWRGFMD